MMEETAKEKGQKVSDYLKMGSKSYVRELEAKLDFAYRTINLLSAELEKYSSGSISGKLRSEAKGELKYYKAVTLIKTRQDLLTIPDKCLVGEFSKHGLTPSDGYSLTTLKRFIKRYSAPNKKIIKTGLKSEIVFTAIELGLVSLPIEEESLVPTFSSLGLTPDEGFTKEELELFIKVFTKNRKTKTSLG